MATMIFVNLPVKDLNKSVAFFTQLGYTFNPQFTDENATCMVVSDTIYVMLLVEPFFKNFTKKDLVDATRSAETIISFSASSREEVDDRIAKAVAAGATTPNAPVEMEGMYGRSFDDLDGHHWEYMYMNMTATSQSQPAAESVQ